MGNVSKKYENWNGIYPAPPGASVIFTCPDSAKFTDGSLLHNATCSIKIPGTWESSFNENDVRCGSKFFLKTWPEKP